VDHHSDWNYDFAGLNVAQAVAQQGSRRAIIAHLWGIVEGTSRVIGIENCWLNLGAQPKIMAAWFDRYADWLCGLVDNVAARAWTSSPSPTTGAATRPCSFPRACGAT
jgi:hypothetical protein